MTTASPWSTIGTKPVVNEAPPRGDPEPVRQVSQSDVATLFQALQRRNEERVAAEAAAAREAEQARLEEERRRIAEEQRERHALLAWRSYRSRCQSALLRRVVAFAAGGLVVGAVVGAVAGAWRATTAGAAS